jgi:hypothetical protein
MLIREIHKRFPLISRSCVFGKKTGNNRGRDASPTTLGRLGGHRARPCARVRCARYLCLRVRAPGGVCAAQPA